MPLIYYIYKSPDFSFRGSSEFERVNAAAMHRWLLNSLFVGAFVGHSDQTIAMARGVIRDHLRVARDFPITKLFDTMARGGRLSQIDERAIEELFDLEYGRPRTFVALSLIYGELDWVSASYHVDHIIPRAAADRNVLRGINLPEHRIKEILASVNRLGNLQLLPPGENIEKSDLSFDSWITGRDMHYRGRHMIPDHADLWVVTQLPEFVREREKLIRQRLLRLVGRVAA